MLTNLGFHVQAQLLCFEDRTNAYPTLCQVWVSKKLQEKSQKKRNYGAKSAKHTFGAMYISVWLNEW
jgi:hypothetical protein